MKRLALITIVLALCAADASAAFRDGVAALARQDYAAALTHFTDAANDGDVRAQFNIGFMYRRGQGVAKDPFEAAKWYRMAADQGHVVAQYVLGAMAETGNGLPQNDRVAATWYLQAAQAGHVQAQFLIGQRYLAGRGVARDPVEGYVWLAIAALQGHVQATDLHDQAAAQLSTEQRTAADARIEAWSAEQEELLRSQSILLRPAKADLPTGSNLASVVGRTPGRMVRTLGRTLPRADLETILRFYGPRGEFHRVNSTTDPLNAFRDASRFDLEAYARHFAPSRYTSGSTTTLRNR